MCQILCAPPHASSVCAGSLHHRQNRMLCGAPQTLATATRRRLVRLLLRPSAEKEFVDLDRAAE
jgi:hypothetical protein